ncbi:hypothetical protein HMPREF9576_00863 [Cutibacterium acnes HL110PA2]|nr:hypothetical protein HMPREF9576_00863 [Cutibacterium acnes HL110PA2]
MADDRAPVKAHRYRSIHKIAMTFLPESQHQSHPDQNPDACLTPTPT